MKFEEAFAKKKLSRKKERDVILLDETKVKRDGRLAYVTINMPRSRTKRGHFLARKQINIISLSTINVVRQALRSCKGTPIVITDHAPWYKYAFQSLGLCNIQRTFSFRNYIERWYRTFKQRTRRFFNNFPIRDPTRAIERIDRFLHLFAFWYNRMRPHETFKCTPSMLK